MNISWNVKGVGKALGVFILLLAVSALVIRLVKASADKVYAGGSSIIGGIFSFGA